MEVELSKRAEKELKKMPAHVVRKLLAWVESIENEGLERTSRIPGFHDEPLRGKRKGQRSVRLSRAYRAIYSIRSKGRLEIAYVEEVNKHEY